MFKHKVPKRNHKSNRAKYSSIKFNTSKSQECTIDSAWPVPFPNELFTLSSWYLDLFSHVDTPRLEDLPRPRLKAKCLFPYIKFLSNVLKVSTEKIWPNLTNLEQKMPLTVYDFTIFCPLIGFAQALNLKAVCPM